MSSQTTINLQRNYFTETEKTLAEFEGITASIFLYRSGVHGLRLKNRIGEIIILPFQGQQIWHAEFHRRPLTMKSMFSEPYPTTDYLHTYGAFLIHCGATAMGVPTAEDSHPLHGELPNASYQTAQLLIGQDEQGSYMGVTGSYQYTVAFNHNYVARPLVKLYADSSRIPISMTIKNLKQSEMELMYLAHANFRPVDNGKLVYSALCNPERVRVRSSVPAHIRPPEGYRRFLAELEAQPEKHNIRLIWPLIRKLSFLSTIGPMRPVGPTVCKFIRMALPTLSATVRPSWSTAYAGSAGQPIKTPWASFCRLLPSQKVIPLKKPRVTSRFCHPMVNFTLIWRWGL
jgi:hypothetical protein